MLNTITIYIAIGLFWGIGFEFLVWHILKVQGSPKKMDQALQVILWPVFICVFIWGMFFKPGAILNKEDCDKEDLNKEEKPKD